MSKEGKKDKVNTIMAALAAYSDSTAVTTKLVTRVITSDKLKAIVRKTIINPVQSAFVPKIKCIGVDKCRELFNALLVLFDHDLDTLCEILNSTKEDIANYKKHLEEESPYYAFSIWYYGSLADGDVTKLVRYHDALVYISIQFTCKNKYDNSIMATIDFLSPTKKVYELFVDEIEKSRRYIEKGYAEKYNRRVRVIQMNCGRTKITYATVPNTIIISSDVKDDVDRVVASVQKNAYIKDKYGVNKTIGVLLHGPAGTGKSTIVRYLAMVLNRGLILTGASDLKEAINYVKDGHRSENSEYIILIEDIDFKFVDRRKLMKDKKKNSEDINPKIDDDDDNEMSWGGTAFESTDTLFQLLDGVLADSRIMVCATTNYKERLDPALIRDGRFDHDIEVLGLSYDDASAVCKEFDVKPEDVNLDKFPLPIIPATLQKKILHFKTHVIKDEVDESESKAPEENS